MRCGTYSTAAETALFWRRFTRQHSTGASLMMRMVHDSMGGAGEISRCKVGDVRGKNVTNGTRMRIRYHGFSVMFRKAGHLKILKILNCPFGQSSRIHNRILVLHSAASVLSRRPLPTPRAQSSRRRRRRPISTVGYTCIHAAHSAVPLLEPCCITLLFIWYSSDLSRSAVHV